MNEIFILFSLHCLIPNLQDRALEQEQYVVTVVGGYYCDGESGQPTTL